MTVTYTDINRSELNELIQRVEHAIEHDLALGTEDLRKLLAAIQTLLIVHNKIDQDECTLHKLKKLLGMVTQSERRPSPQKMGSKKGASSKKRKLPIEQKTEIQHHKLEEYQKGSVCPVCQIGKLYKHEPAQLLRITGHAPLTATKHISEQLRCNGCLGVVTATLQEEVLVDGHANQKYGYSARAWMAISKCYSGMPYHHQSNLNHLMGCSVSASTIFDQCQLVAEALEPVFIEMQSEAANGYHFAIDDTHNRILEQKPEMRERPDGKGKRLRSGIYTSGLISETQEGHEIILFETSLGHAGEHLDSILKHREANLPCPLIMSDALSNNSSKYVVEKVFCNSHARRKFYDLKNKSPEEIEWVLEQYSQIWKNEREAKEKHFNVTKRLEHHISHSLPIMQTIRQWATNKIESFDFEEHSGLGEAIKYFLRHYDNLVKFCTIEGAKIDNNRMEERLKIKIRSRKNAHFYKTPKGAKVANIITSVIATTDVAGLNSFDYLLKIQQNRVEVKQKPSSWLPWNYLDTLAQKQHKLLKPDKVD
jgi:transposase